jgi:hypothetical protein
MVFFQFKTKPAGEAAAGKKANGLLPIGKAF